MTKGSSIRNMSAAARLLALLTAFTPGRFQAVELEFFGTNRPSVDFHGFVSQGFPAFYTHD